MTHPHEDMARMAKNILLNVNGIFACAVRAQAEAPKTPLEIREEAQAEANKIWLPSARPPQIEKYIAREEAALRRHLAKAPAPFPHLVEGTEDLALYLSGLTDLLGPNHDDRIEARVGATRMIADSWDYLIVAVAVPVSHPANKSLARALRRVRAKVEGK